MFSFWRLQRKCAVPRDQTPFLRVEGGGGGSRGIKSPLPPPPKEKEEIDARPEMEGAEGAWTYPRRKRCWCQGIKVQCTIVHTLLLNGAFFHLKVSFKNAKPDVLYVAKAFAFGDRFRCGIDIYSKKLQGGRMTDSSNGVFNNTNGQMKSTACMHHKQKQNSHHWKTWMLAKEGDGK